MASEQKDVWTHILEQGGVMALILAAFAGLIGWRIGSAQDAVRIQQNHDAVDRLEKRVRELEKSGAVDGKQLAATLATMQTSLAQMATHIENIERRTQVLEKEI